MIINRKLTACLLLTILGCSFLFQTPLMQNPVNKELFSDMSDGSQSPQKKPNNAGDPLIEPLWWNVSWQYRKIIEINSTTVDREDSLFEIWINFTAVLADELEPSSMFFDNNSIRIIEHDLSTGNLLIHDASYQPYDESSKYEVPSSLWYGEGYSPSVNAYIKISWVLNGTTAQDVTRGYAIYFDTTEYEQKAPPAYWTSTTSNLTISTSEWVTSASFITSSLLTLNSSNLAVFLSNNLTSNTQYNGQVLRMWYTGDPSNPKMSEYRVNATLMTYNYFQASYYNTNLKTWTAASTITIPRTSILVQDNKIILKNVQPSAHSSYYSLNITYEIFENSRFVKITFTVLKKHIDLGTVRILDIGELNPNLGTTLTTARHQNAEGKTGYGTPAMATSKWDCYWHNNPIYKDFLGFMVSPSAWFNFTSSGAAYRVMTEISDITTGSTKDDAIYEVTAPKGIAPEENIYTPLERLYNDTYTPKTYTLYMAKEKQASITVTVRDQDNFPVGNTYVWLNASEDLSTNLDVKPTDSNGRCIFTEKALGFYNLTVTMANRTQNVTFSTNRSGEVVEFQNINNQIDLNASIWRIRFDIRDKDGNPLPDGGWISINQTETGDNYLTNISLSNGEGFFTWSNVSAYNYSLYFNATASPLYNHGIPILISASSLDPIMDHIAGELTTETVLTDMARVNFTVLDETGSPVYGAIIKVCNLTDIGGPVNHDTPLVNLTQTGVDGKASFFWRTRDAGIGENYSFYINFVNQNFDLPLNSTPAGVYNTDYQNFTFVTSVEKIVKIQRSTNQFLGKLIAVNPPTLSVYWNETFEIQALYKHSEMGSEFLFASPTSITLTLWSAQGDKISGPHPMQGISPVGRFEYAINVLTSCLTVGKTYTISVEAAEAGFSPVTPLYFYISVEEIPTELTAAQASFAPYWTDPLSFEVQYQAAFPRTIDFALEFPDRAGAIFSEYVPLIENVWNLTQIELNISNLVTTGPYWIDVKDPTSGQVLLTSYGGVDSISGQWSDTNLSFPITASETVTHFDVFATCHYTRIGMVVNYTIEDIDGNSAVYLESPGNGYRIKNIVLDIYQTDPSQATPPDWLNVTVVGSPYTTEHAITSWRNFALKDIENYYLDPEQGSINFTFQSNSPLVFNATFSIVFESVTSKHYNADIDEREFAFLNVLSGDSILALPSDMAWSTTSLELSFSDVTNTTSEPVIPSEVTLQLTYNSVVYNIADSVPGSFSVVISNVTPSRTLSFTLSFPNIQSYQLSVLQKNQWVNHWGLATYGAVSYYMIGNSTFAGIGDPSVENDGVYTLFFDPRNTDIGSKNIQITGSLPNYATEALGVSINVLAVPTSLFYNGTSLTPDFQGEDSIYVLDAKNWTFYLNDTHNTLPVFAASGSYTWRRLDLTTGLILEYGVGVLSDDLTGNYTLDFNTLTRQAGRYSFFIRLEKENYEVRLAFLTVDIRIRPMHITGRDDLSKGSVIIKPQGDIIPFTITLIDESLGNQPLSGATVTLRIQNDQYGILTFTMIEDISKPGTYSVSLSTQNFDAFLAQVTFSAQIFVAKENYALSEEYTFTIAVSPPEWFGVAQIYWILILATAVVILGTLGIVKLVRNARIPRMIKDIARTRADIKKDRILTEISIVPSKEEILYEMIVDDWKSAGVTLQSPKKTGIERPPPEAVFDEPVIKNIKAKPEPKETEAKPEPKETEAKPEPKETEAKPELKETEVKPEPNDTEAKP